MMGAKLVLPGRNLSSEALHELIVAEGVTVGAAVPTIWLGLAEYCRAKDLGLGRFNRAFIGGSAASPQLVEALFRDFGVRTIHAWGMTETTHASTLTSPPVDITLEEAVALSTVQGKPVYGCEIRIAGEDGRPLPRGGETPGELQSRGHWMASSYFKRPDVKLLTDDGWMQTGDVGLIDEENVLHITDRQKDVIKSGGEWISSLTLENEAMSHPGLQRAAAFRRAASTLGRAADAGGGAGSRLHCHRSGYSRPSRQALASVVAARRRRVRGRPPLFAGWEGAEKRLARAVSHGLRRLNEQASPGRPAAAMSGPTRRSAIRRRRSWW